MNEIVIGCDANAVDLKNYIKKNLIAKGYSVEDVGCNAVSESIMYPLVAEKAITAIAASGYKKKGILICGTGIGMAICANKFPGIYAAQLNDVYQAERAALSNDANVITLGAFVLGTHLAWKLVQEWLGLNFIPGPSSEKVNAIKEFEKKHFK